MLPCYSIIANAIPSSSKIQNIICQHPTMTKAGYYQIHCHQHQNDHRTARYYLCNRVMKQHCIPNHNTIYKLVMLTLLHLETRINVYQARCMQRYESIVRDTQRANSRDYRYANYYFKQQGSIFSVNNRFIKHKISIQNWCANAD